MHGAVVLDVDVDVVDFLDLLDVLAARADQQADLVGVDLELRDARGVGGEVVTRFGDDGLHVVEDLDAGFARHLKGALDLVPGQTVDFQIHLEAGDAVAGAGHLEIHVAAVVFGAQDVGDEFVAVFADEQADRDAGYGFGHGDARIHREKRRLRG